MKFLDWQWNQLGGGIHLTLASILILLCSSAFMAGGAMGKPNILLIMSDDLNHVDIPAAHTPNLDRLLAVSTQFRGYPNIPWCNPSRVSFLAGLRPEALGVYDNNPRAKQVLPDRYWLPMGLDEAGYHTVGVGKIAHLGKSAFNVPGWDRYLHLQNRDPSVALGTIVPYRDTQEVAYFDAAVPLYDEASRNGAITLLEEARGQSDPWFVAVGFYRPHGRWFSHRGDWEVNGFLNPDGTANIDSIPDLDMDRSLQVKNYSSYPPFLPKVDLPDAKRFRMGYRACITHIDGLVGDVLDAVDTDPSDPALNLPPDLAVIFTSDHGHGTYQLGARVFSKVNPHETGNRMPLWIHMPGQTSYQDRTDTIVELVDLYPTLLDLAGNQRYIGGRLMTHGQSLIPHLLSDDWIGWNNWASTIIVNRNQNKRWHRTVTPDFTAYRQLWNGRAAIFANRDVDIEFSGSSHFYPADPEHWCNISQAFHSPLMATAFANFPAKPCSADFDVIEDPADHATVSFFGEQGLRYTISASRDLVTWNPLEVADGQSAEISRTYQIDERRRFFRVNLWIDPLVDFSFMKSR